MRILLTIALFVIAQTAAAVPMLVAQYKVSNATDNNGNDIGHGLWTWKPGESKYKPNIFSIDDGTLFSIFDDNGTLTGSLVGSASQRTGSELTAIFDVSFSGFAETHTDYKVEHGIPYNPLSVDMNGILADPFNGDIDFFTMIEGTITIDNYDYNATFCCNPVFQFGIGASAKNTSQFGGSAWLDSSDKGHWDINLNFTPVPEPTPIALLGLGVALIGVLKRRNAKR